MSEPTITHRDIVIAFCEAFDISENLLHRRHCRTKWVLEIRHASWAIMREFGLSFTQIGRRAGGRDHSTIMHGCDSHYLRNHGPEFLGKLERIKSRIPEIASERAVGRAFDTGVGKVLPIEETPPAVKDVALARLTSPDRRRLSRIVTRSDEGTADYEQRMRAHGQMASAMLLEALRQEVGAA